MTEDEEGVVDLLTSIGQLVLEYGHEMAEARGILDGANSVRINVGFGRVRSRLERFVWDRRAEQAAARSELRSGAQAKVKSIPRRRREIFEKSDGKCHYCGTALALDGKWHIEHRMPKALLGTNEPSNLVASCVPCNMKKRDMTDEEFKALQASA